MKLLRSRRVLCAPYNHAPSHVRKVHTCLGVTCHLMYFWQNDRDVLRATAVTRGWNGYRNKSQHRKSTLEKKILPPLLQGFEPATFQSRVRLSYPRSRSSCLLADTFCDHMPKKRKKERKKLFKYGTVNFANSVSPSPIMKKIRTGRKVKGLKRCR